MNKKTNRPMPYKGNSMEDYLGFVFLPTDEDGTIHAEMEVDHRTCQPFGVVNGGASVALAETLAGHGSMDLCAEDEVACGIQVSANHLAPAPVGSKLCASGKLVHKGRTTHLWDVTLKTAEGKLISTVRVVNYIVKKS